jgi:hypothetical protein
LEPAIRIERTTCNRDALVLHARLTGESNDHVLDRLCRTHR